MYEAFYGFREKPFSIQPDPDFLFMGARHRLAYAMLEYGIENGAAFTVLTGEIGCGKTTLIRHLLNHLPGHLTVGLVSGPHRRTAGILEWIGLALGLPAARRSGLDRHADLQRFLIDEYAAGRRVLLIIDEAQNLDAGDLESLRMLSNINADKDQLLQIILAGQPQFRDTLQRPGLQQFTQRIAAHFHVTPLETAEVASYIAHRMAVAGRSSPLLTAEACARIAEASGGIPRRINILCDTTLVYGFSGETTMIDRPLVDDVIRDRQAHGLPVATASSEA